MTESINNDPVKDHVDAYLVRAKAIIEGKKVKDVEHEDEEEWVPPPKVQIFMPRQQGLSAVTRFLNVFQQKEPNDDDLGRPSKRP